MKPLLIAPALVAFVLAGSAASTRALPPPPIADYGDAPEGLPAYPWSGVMGAFPTCYLGGPAGYIAHGQSPQPPVYFGLTVDFEPEGNGGACPGGSPNGDECASPPDADAGLVRPQAYTIAGGVPISCGSSTVPALGPTCGTGTWGADIDAVLVNQLNAIVYLNVVVDWDQNGQWGAGPSCGGSPVPERIVADVPIQPFYAGPVSGLPVPTFTIGPDSGYVWVRLTLTESPMGPFWDGSGVQPLYDVGETEDYLLKVSGSGGPPVDPVDEFGDAPEDRLAYPDNGVVGRFPTCTGSGPAGSVVRHRVPSGRLFIGFAPPDVEPDGNAGDCAFQLYDRDECSRFDGPEAGLLIVDPYTLSGGLVTTCPQAPGRPLGGSCAAVFWGQDLDLQVENQTADDAYLNVLFDWNRDGVWGGLYPGCPGGAVIEERVVQDLVVPAGFSGPVSSLNHAGFHTGAPGHVWGRFTLTPAPISDPAWDGSGLFRDGETEDYLVAVADPSGLPRGGLDDARGSRLALEPPRPNPSRGVTWLRFTHPGTGSIALTVHDLQGRVRFGRTFGGLAAGRHEFVWDGVDATGHPLPAGLYIVRLEGAGSTTSRKVMLSGR